MSALPPKADIAERDHDGRFVPKADIGLSLDHVVSADEERRRNGQTKRLGGSGSDDEVDGQLSRLGTFDDTSSATASIKALAVIPADSLFVAHR
jgi:hypothetical protein